jgi:uncharacterized membrane protein YfcA
MLHADFNTRQSVALSNMTILGGALANLVCNINRKHPRANRSLIDWDLILVMEPATIVGALLGGYLNKVSGVLRGSRGSSMLPECSLPVCDVVPAMRLPLHR